MSRQKEVMKPSAEMHKEQIDQLYSQIPTKERKARWTIEQELEMVEGIFHWHECPGAELRFTFDKYVSVPAIKYRLKDGKAYRLPRMVVGHLNETMSVPVSSWISDKDGNPIISNVKRIKRTSFEPFIPGYGDIPENIESGIEGHILITGK